MLILLEKMNVHDLKIINNGYESYKNDIRSKEEPFLCKYNYEKLKYY